MCSERVQCAVSSERVQCAVCSERVQCVVCSERVQCIVCSERVKCLVCNVQLAASEKEEEEKQHKFLELGCIFLSQNCCMVQCISFLWYQHLCSAQGRWSREKLVNPWHGFVWQNSLYYVLYETYQCENCLMCCVQGIHVSEQTTILNGNYIRYSFMAYDPHRAWAWVSISYEALCSTAMASSNLYRKPVAFNLSQQNSLMFLAQKFCKENV